MIVIQLIIIAAAIGVILLALGKRSSHSVRAWKKLALIFLSAAMVVAVLFPEATNTIARYVGVGRGADLLLYATVIAFLFFVLNNYLHQQDEKDRLFRLARKVAILEAESKYPPSKVRKNQ